MSGRKNVIQAHVVSDATSLGASFTSPQSDVGFQDNYTYEFAFTGTPTGTIDIQETVHEAAWTTIYTITVTLGVPNPITFERNQCGARFARFVYTRTSGTGTVTATIQAKGL